MNNLIVKIVFLLSMIFGFLEANPNKILIISADTHKSSQSAKFAFTKKQAKDIGLEFDYKFSNQIKGRKELLSQYDMVIFDSLRVKNIKRSVEAFKDSIKALDNIILPMAKEENPYMQNITSAQRDILYDYWRNGGVSNIQNMLKYIKHKVLSNDTIEIEKPKVLPLSGIYHPRHKDLVFASHKEYFDFLDVDFESNKKPIIAIYFGRNSIVSNILAPINDAIKRIEAKGAIALPFFFKTKSKQDAIGLEFLQDNGQRMADVLLYFFSSIHSGIDKIDNFKTLNIPILHALTYRWGDQKKWERDKIGMPFGSIASSFVMAESLGFTDSMVVATQDNIDKEFHPIPYQMDSFISKALKLARLQKIENRDKKVALMYYALGRDKIGASFLNIPKSLESIVKKLNIEGYTVRDINASTILDQTLKTIKVLYDIDLYSNAKRMLDEGQADLYPYDKYMQEFYNLPVELRTDMIRVWGYPLESKMLVYKKDEKRWYFLIPRITLGNVIIMPQPHPLEREDSIRDMNLDIGREDERDWHNPTAAVNHSYFATYLYLKNQFKTDALVHLGTHGTVEWSLGKERGLSIYDSALMCIADIPHFYPYIVNNTAETIQVRRRARGVIISHQTPPFALAGSYNEVNELMELNAQFKTVTKGLMREQVKKEIIQKSIALNIHKDIEMSQKQIEGDFHHFLHELEKYIRSFTAVSQPLGQHTFGTIYNEEHLITTIAQMLGKEYLVKTNGEDYAIANYKDFNSSKAYRLIKKHIIEKKEINNSEFIEFINQGKELYKLLASQKENKNLIRALDGEHIEAGTGGGPIRNPQSLPTGVNLVSFDPTKVPTPAAYKTGRLLMDRFIEEHYRDNGIYPNKITFNLWGLETVRHHGVLESQLLAAIGVKPIRDSKGRIKDTEIIPYKELKRPRIDVVVSATGLYRDMYPNTIKLIADAINKIANLKEKYNYLRKNSISLFENLRKNHDINESEAKYFSSIRIFSSKTGNYGSGVDAIEQTSRWRDDKRITKDYLEHTGYYFGNDTKRWNEKRMDISLYAKNLSGTNAVIFSRSSNLYGLLTSDDPYAHFGSIGMAIRNIDGKTPKTYISNLRDPNDAKIETTARFMSTELRSRYFHPNWIRQMQKEEYGGTVEISSVVNNFWGWQVVNPDVVRSDQWDEFKSIYVDDKYKLKIDEWFKKHNPQALADIVEKMLEAYRKNYWKTGKGNIEDLLELLDDLKKNYNTISYNTKLDEFTEKAKQGFGIESLREGMQASKAKQKGQKLKEVQQSKVDKDYTYLYFVLFILALILAGMLYEYRKKNEHNTRQ
ncbi:MAG: cobaltochelatase subunit CobN [Sulfurovum sp.]|nr:cobaltochelatase subunit CobN [Sulfurovum sp.]